MNADHPLIDRLRRTIAERVLLWPGARVLVAVSGGPDSLALLHALSVLRDELSIELVAGHLNHRMRPEESEADVRFIRDMTSEWDIAVEVGVRDVSALARRTGLSLEEAGREARYRFFARAARRHGCDLIATAHTADDQAETVLLHLLRGTGLDGLAGIPYCRPLRRGRRSLDVIRPLLEVTRAQVLSYCCTRNLQPRSDATNESPAFLRNRVRRNLMPLLEADYSPALRRHLLRLARLAEEETAYLNEQARQLLAAARLADQKPPSRSDPGSAGGGAASWPRSGQRRGNRSAATQGGPGRPACRSGQAGELRFGREADSSGGRAPGRAPSGATSSADPSLPPLPPTTVRLSRAVLAAAPAVLTRRALRLALQELQPGPPPEWVTVNRLLALIAGKGPGFSLPGGQAAARVTADALLLEPVRRDHAFLDEDGVRLAIPGVTAVPWTRGAISVRRLDAGQETGWGFLAGLLPLPADQALFDEERVVGNLTVRPPRPGDRIRPLGMQGHRKLQDLLTDRKVPVETRRRLPVICDAEKIVWVAGHCASEAVRVTPATRSALWLTWGDDAGANGA